MLDHINQLLGDHFIVIMIRVLVILVLSGLIGFERELKNHSAGFRTHILVGIGSCLMMVLSIFGFNGYIDTYANVSFDPSRIPSYVVSGIGFLGAGTIIVYGGTIRGLTTAASIWTVAGLGLVVGAGMYATAVFTTLVILLSLVFLNNFEKMFTKGRSSILIEIVAMPELKINEVIHILESAAMMLKKVEINKTDTDLRRIYLKVEWIPENERAAVLEKISLLSEVKSVTERG